MELDMFYFGGFEIDFEICGLIVESVVVGKGLLC